MLRVRLLPRLLAAGHHCHRERRVLCKCGGRFRRVVVGVRLPALPYSSRNSPSNNPQAGSSHHPRSYKVRRVGLRGRLSLYVLLLSLLLKFFE